MLYIAFGFTVHKLERFKDFSLALGMLSAIAYSAKFAQNCPKPPKFAKICPKTISLRNFDMLPKIEILDFFKKNNFYV
jgi:hypothetical protein